MYFITLYARSISSSMKLYITDPIEINLNYKPNSKSLSETCKIIKQLDTKMIVLSGRAGSGKSYIAEKLTMRKNIFTNYGHISNNRPPAIFDFVKTSNVYAVIDDIHCFSEEDIMLFLAKAEKHNKIPVFTIQSIKFVKPFFLELIKKYEATILHVIDKDIPKQTLS